MDFDSLRIKTERLHPPEAPSLDVADVETARYGGELAKPCEGLPAQALRTRTRQPWRKHRA